MRGSAPFTTHQTSKKSIATHKFKSSKASFLFRYSPTPNLALSCQGCNNHKHTKLKSRDPLTRKLAALFLPRRQNWAEHFTWSDDYLEMIGLTPTGRATVTALGLNRAEVVNLRRILSAFGEHPPIIPT